MTQKTFKCTSISSKKTRKSKQIKVHFVTSTQISQNDCAIEERYDNADKMIDIYKEIVPPS